MHCKVAANDRTHPLLHRGIERGGRRCFPASGQQFDTKSGQYRSHMATRDYGCSAQGVTGGGLLVGRPGGGQGDRGTVVY